MKNKIETISKIELVELETSSIEQNANQERFVVIDKSIFRHIVIHESPIAGRGSCRSCDCRGYISKHNNTHECKTCGHHYSQHRDY